MDAKLRNLLIVAVLLVAAGIGVLSLLQSATLDDNLRNLLVYDVTLIGGVVMVVVTMMQARASLAKDFEKLELDRQKAIVEAQRVADAAAAKRQEETDRAAAAERQQALVERQSIQRGYEQMKDAFAIERSERQELQKRFDEREEAVNTLTEQASAQEKQIAGLNEKLRINTEALNTKDGLLQQLYGKQRDMDKRIHDLEADRDGWRTLANQREAELKKMETQLEARDKTIVELNKRMDEMQKRLDDLEQRANAPAAPKPPPDAPVAET